MPGEHDHRQTRLALFYFLQGLVSIDAGHLDVENDDIGIGVELAQGLLTARGDDGIETLPVSIFWVVARNWASSSTIKTFIFFSIGTSPFASGFFAPGTAMVNKCNCQ